MGRCSSIKVVRGQNFWATLAISGWQRFSHVASSGGERLSYRSQGPRVSGSTDQLLRTLRSLQCPGILVDDFWKSPGGVGRLRISTLYAALRKFPKTGRVVREVDPGDCRVGTGPHDQLREARAHRVRDGCLCGTNARSFDHPASSLSARLSPCVRVIHPPVLQIGSGTLPPQSLRRRLAL